MSSRVNLTELMRAFLYGLACYLLGGLVSLPLRYIRENTILVPRVSLVAVGIGGIALGLLLGLRGKSVLVRFFVTAITSYLGVILVNFGVNMIMGTGPGAMMVSIMTRVVLPAVIYGAIFGLQVYGASAVVHFAVVSLTAALPVMVAAFFYHTAKVLPVAFESMWTYAALGAAVSVSCISYVRNAGLAEVSSPR